eukprot:scaffold3290_cov165-Ochromonas_danica.AAC.8
MPYLCIPLFLVLNDEYLNPPDALSQCFPRSRMDPGDDLMSKALYGLASSWIVDSSKRSCYGWELITL